MPEVKFAAISPRAKLPTRGSDAAAGWDLYAAEDVVLPPLYVPHPRTDEVSYLNSHIAVPTHLMVAIPRGYYGRIAPRSGLAFKHGVDVLAGVVDSDYRGELKVILINMGSNALRIEAGDRIAQLIFESIMDDAVPVLVDKDQLDATDRGEGGFGSTGA